MTVPRQISIDEAYQEACLALGEAIVTQRLMGKTIAALDGEVALLSQPSPEPPSSDRVHAPYT